MILSTTGTKRPFESGSLMDEYSFSHCRSALRLFLLEGHSRLEMRLRKNG
jgi:hypothetical protein